MIAQGSVLLHSVVPRLMHRFGGLLHRLRLAVHTYLWITELADRHARLTVVRRLLAVPLTFLSFSVGVPVVLDAP